MRPPSREHTVHLGNLKHKVGFKCTNLNLKLSTALFVNALHCSVSVVLEILNNAMQIDESGAIIGHTYHSNGGLVQPSHEPAVLGILWPTCYVIFG